MSGISRDRNYPS